MAASGDARPVLVTGVTGQQGGAVARHLQARGIPVRGLTRDASGARARALAARGAEMLEGDLEDRDALGRALEGTRGVFSVQNFWTAGVEGEIRQGECLAEAAREHGTGHFVYSSVASADRDTGLPHFESKWRIEQHVRTLGLPYTVVRPVFFMDNWFVYTAQAIRGGLLPQPLAPRTRLQQIAVDDIGAAVATAFAHPGEWLGRTVELAGEELGMSDIARALGTWLGREVEYVHVPWGDFSDQAGEDMARMYEWFERVGYRVDIEGLRRELPFLKRFAEFLATRSRADL